MAASGPTRSKWSDQITEMLSQGRRNSAARIMNRLRSGSLPGWAGGGPILPSALRRASLSKHGPGNTVRINGALDEADEDEGDDSEKEKDGLTSSDKPKTIIQMKQEKNKLDPELWRQQGNANLGNILSALYAKLLVVMGIAFPMSEVISTYIPPSYYDGFYMYLYFGSIFFMGCMFAQMLKLSKLRKSSSSTSNQQSSQQTDDDDAGSPDLTRNSRRTRYFSNESTDYSSDEDRVHTAIALRGNHHHQDHDELESGLCIHQLNGIVPRTARFCTLCKYVEKTSARKRHEQYREDAYDRGKHRTNFGNFYLRIGAVAFGIGSVIYSALEFGQYFELKHDEKCYNFLVGLTPAVRMVFTFMQMYFIFLNSRMAVSRVGLLKQFGLMHMIGTNLAVWLNVLVQETKHEIVHFYHPQNGTIINGHWHGNGNHHNGKVDTDLSTSKSLLSLNDSDIHHRDKRGLDGPHNMYDCRRAFIMGSLVDNASPFLFPCTIEYSLICAAICYVMWKDMALRRITKISLKRSSTAESILSNSLNKSQAGHGPNKSPHHYTVDCAGSNKGLFGGIFLLVFTIMSLILNFVLIKHPEYHDLATLEVNITEIVLYTTSTIAVLLGMCQMRQLRYEPRKNLELDSILLIVAQSGSFLFNIFCVIGEHLAIRHFDTLSLTIPLLCLVQICLQTIFILDASKRVVITTTQARRKPGREVVTFLLVCNLAMWLINALEKSRGDSHPHQLHFYGVWAWTIITDFSMPLGIFYRFHSTVCLCEIWKKTFKLKSTKF